MSWPGVGAFAAVGPQAAVSGQPAWQQLLSDAAQAATEAEAEVCDYRRP